MTRIDNPDWSAEKNFAHYHYREQVDFYAGENKPFAREIEDIVSEGKKGNAINVIDERIAKTGGTAYLYLLKGSIYMTEYKYDDAMQQYDMALTVEPCNWTARRYKIDIFRHRGEHDQALAVYDDCPDDYPIFKAIYLAEIGRFEEAVKIAKDLKGDHSSHFMQWERLGDIFHNNDLLEEAEFCYKRAAK